MTDNGKRLALLQDTEFEAIKDEEYDKIEQFLEVVDEDVYPEK